MGKYTTTAEGIEAEPHPLWEYPAYPRSEVTELLTFDLTVDVPEKTILKNEGEIALNDLNKPCHGVALWMEYHLTDARTVSGGLVKVRQRGRRNQKRERESERDCDSVINAGLLTTFPGLFNKNFFTTFMNHIYFEFTDTCAGAWQLHRETGVESKPQASSLLSTSTVCTTEPH